MSVAYKATWASRGTVLVPLGVRAIRGGVWIYGSTKPSGLFANRITGHLASIATLFVPGFSTSWAPPFEDDVFHDWLLKIRDVLRTPVESWVVHLPSDPRRRRFNLLLLDRHAVPVGFAKFTTNRPNAMALEALRRFADEHPRSFWSPVLILSGELGDYSFVLTTTMPNRPHAPARLSGTVRRRILSEIQDRLSDMAQAGSPVHGDFAPWNVRQFRDGSVAVVDWEELAAGVPVADDLWFVVSVHALRRSDSSTVLREVMKGSPYTRVEVSAAAEFWLQRLSRPEAPEINPEIEMPANLDFYGQRMRTLLEAIR